MTIDLKISVQNDSSDIKNEFELIGDALFWFTRRQRELTQKVSDDQAEQSFAGKRIEIGEKINILVAETISLANISEMMERVVADASGKHELTSVNLEIGYMGPEGGGRSELHIILAALGDYANPKINQSVTLATREAIIELIKKVIVSVRLEKEIGHLSITDSGIDDLD